MHGLDNYALTHRISEGELEGGKVPSQEGELEAGKVPSCRYVPRGGGGKVPVLSTQFLVLTSLFCGLKKW